jgi:hypothetical protein
MFIQDQGIAISLSCCPINKRNRHVKWTTKKTKVFLRSRLNRAIRNPIIQYKLGCAAAGSERVLCPRVLAHNHTFLEFEKAEEWYGLLKKFTEQASPVKTQQRSL